jgi:hypothetical protein
MRACAVLNDARHLAEHPQHSPIMLIVKRCGQLVRFRTSGDRSSQ